MNITRAWWANGPTITKNVHRLPNDEERGYGRDYASDPAGGWWLAWVEDCFDPPIYAFREGSWENAYDLAAGTLCHAITREEYESGDYGTDDDFAGWHVDGASAAIPFGVDTDMLMVRHWRGPEPR